ncbi:TPR-like protein, partial [Ramicandelaber brevisporus]
EWFPGSTRLRVLAAEWFTNCREFESAEAEFEVVRSSDPCCLDGMDVYSGILFTAGNTTQLCTLAQECIELDRFRAETCVVVGNYHALRKDHERAVLQFQRALRLNSLSQNTWTLLAHSFLELKNIAAAIEAHQRALLINEHHVPAWYGLGLIYETMELPHYAINYYQRAAALASRDPAMWRALGSCYQSIGNTEAAISSFKRAITGAPHSDLPVLLNIA